MAETITLNRFNDMHIHLRADYLLQNVVPFTTRCCAKAVVMPNTRPRAILTAEDVIWYRSEIEKALSWVSPRPSFEPLMTIEIRNATTPQMIEEARKAGAVAGKVYPLGVTTNSEEGLREFFNPSISETFRAMQETEMLLLIHGELDHPRTLFTGREKIFIEQVFYRLAEKYFDLRIVLEHISTRAGIEAVKKFGKNVAGSLTAHHACLTLNDCRLNPHHICNPTPKDFDDRDAILEAMTGGNPKFFLGSDSAPHCREKKERREIACGVFSAPVLPEVLAEIFEDAGCLNGFENFTSRFGAEFYGLPNQKEKISLVKKPWIVPEQYGFVVPFKAGQELRWQLV